MSKFEIGDKVKVREDLIINKQYDGCLWTKEMNFLKGKVITIINASDDPDCYDCKELEDTCFCLSNEMFEDSADENTDWVYIVHTYENEILCVTKDETKAEQTAIEYVKGLHNRSELNLTMRRDIADEIRIEHSYALAVWIDYKPID